MFPVARRLGTAALIASLVGACGGRDAATFSQDAPADVPAIETTAKRPVAVVEVGGKPQIALDRK